MASFAGQVAVITGASSGIGWEMAKEFAREKCHIGLVARRKEKLDALADELRQMGVRTAVAPADVSDRRACIAAIHALRDQLGPIDVLFANSGVGIPTYLDPPNMDEVDNMIRVNFLGVVYAIEAVLPDMVKRGKGHLSAVSSLASYKGMPGESGYCASKAAVNVYLEGLRIQLRPRGIWVTTMCPGFIRTPMTSVNNFQMPYLMDADRAARLMMASLKRRDDVYNFPWQTTVMMKLTRWMPDWMVRYFLSEITENRPLHT